MKLSREEQLELVNAARLGDQDAYERLYREITPMLRGTLHRIVPGDDLDDVVQESMIRAFRKLHMFKGDSKFSTWCQRVGINHALMHVRSLKRETRSVVASIDDPNETDGGSAFMSELGYEDRTFEQRLAFGIVHRALDSLKEVPRQAIEMQLEGYSTEEISGVTGLHLGTIKSLIRRGKITMGEVMTGKRPRRTRLSGRKRGRKPMVALAA
jgi:RNA polymerase sigma-70 factor, ECF subfamily